ncbi:LacI family DNA-binding transcriptional regulator [Aureimonas altamirensis]|uniref:LacI family DNA-binding transcriptional regulator n=1 Tax=Aureimonas altamirensis TaxID=370622 RepID=UPI001E4490A3|nr:LacI family DNA-binding transcriptional regulator [Aureimonas altamirensis]UHD45672.1 LacI family DNA-binding transcriptional regulator [Aureimonas altamirensis]
MKDRRGQPADLSAVTLREVSREAGVGASTVSRVLRNQGSFSARTRDRVLQAVEKLGYVPNRLAGALASAGSNLVGIVIPSLHNVVFPDLLRGVTRQLDRTGQQAVIGVSEYSIEREEALVASMLAWRPSALLLVGLEHTDRTRQMLDAAHIRVAELLDLDGEGVDIVVGFSHREAGRACARYLLERGYRKIAYIGRDFASDRRSAKRCAGFREILREAGLDLVAIREVVGESSTELGRAALGSLLAERVPMDAVFCSNDDYAVGALFHCMAHGIDVPGQLAIMGYNGLDIGRAAPLPLATVLTPRVEVGEIAAQKVFSSEPSQRLEVSFTIVPGATA